MQGVHVFDRSFRGLVAPFKRIMTAILLEKIVVPVGYNSARLACLGLEDFPYRREVVVERVPLFAFFRFLHV